MRKHHSGLSLLEVTLATSLMGILLMVLGAALKQSQDVFRNINGMTDASQSLRRLAVALNRDLQRAKLDEIGITTTPASLVAADSRALWMLSNIDPGTGRACYRSDGKPFWVCNILFYASIPTQHAQLFGSTCAGGMGPGGLDDRCPHKLLIRKVIDSGATTNLADDSTVETLLTPAQVSASYLTRPAKFDVSGMRSEAGVSEARLLSPLLLGFDCSKSLGEVTVDFRAVSLPRAQRSVAVGTASLYDSQYTYHFGLTVVPEVR